MIHTGKDKNRSLKQFLIKRFILIMFGVAISEVIINLLFAEFLYPNMSGLLVFTNIRINNISTNFTSGMLQVIVALIVMCLLSLLPNYLADPLEALCENYISNVLQIHLNTKLANEIQSPILEELYYLGLLLLFLFILCVMLLPYLIAAITFSQMVSAKVEDPIHRLTKGMELVSEGKMDSRLTFETEHEFIILRDAFNEMAEQMEQTDKDKRGFEKRRNLLLSDIAHDLKTPITTISGYATALLDHVVEDEEKERQYLEAIKKKSLRMDELIMLLFEYVKLDSEGFVLNRTELDLAELVRENVAMLYTDFEAKKLELVLDVPEEKVVYLADRIQFSRVISNLLINSIRYNMEGNRVVIRITVGDKIQILVGDNGEEIEEEVATHLFEPFVTGDKSRNTRSGSGLGLSIAQKIIDMHGGQLSLDRMKTKEYTKAFLIRL